MDFEVLSIDRKESKMNQSKKAGLLSTLFMGLGQLVITKEYIKGGIFLLFELISLIFIPKLIHNFYGLFSLGTVTGNTNAALNDHSIRFMISGIISLLVLFLILMVYVLNIYDAVIAGRKLDKGGQPPTFKQFVKNFWEKSFPYIITMPSFVMILFFVLLPILFSVFIAFTNYSSPDHIPPAKLVDWVGLNTFKEFLKMPVWNETFVGVFWWTIVWAVSVTFFNFSVGLFIAILLNSEYVKYKRFWRTLYFLPYAVPGVISLLVFSNLLNGQYGPINLTLKELGIIHPYFGLFKENIGWLSDPMMARVTCIAVAVWLGFPYFMALLTGVMTSISPDIYEAAEIDGANKFQKFSRITLPLVITSVAPLLIMTFAFNFNNFGGVYFLTRGNPAGYYAPESGAGATDILITWIFKLTNEDRYYNRAAVMSVLIFIIVAVFSIYNLRRTKAFKNDEY